MYCATLLEVRIIHKVSNRCAFHYSLLIAQVCEIASIVSQRRFSSFHKSKESTKYLYETAFSLTFIVLTVACSVLAVQPSLWLWLSGHSEEAFSEIDAHKDIISQVSYGAYSVGSDGSLTGKVNLTIIKELQSMQIESWPLIVVVQQRPCV